MSFTLLGILNSQAAGGSADTMPLLASFELSSAANSVTFTNIPQDYGNLRLVVKTRSTTANGFTRLYLRMNNLTSSAYFYSAKGTLGTLSEGSQSAVDFYSIDSNGSIWWSYQEHDFPNYTRDAKPGIAGLFRSNNLKSNQSQNAFGSYQYNSTTVDPLNRIEIYPQTGQLSAGSTFYLYGWGEAA